MPSSALSRCWPRKTSGAPDTRPCSLAKATIEPVKVMAPITVPRPISIRLCILILPGDADAEGLGRDEGGGGHEHRGEADQRMEGGHELRQRRHLDAPGHEGADRAADHQAPDDQPGRDHARRVATVTPMAITMPTMPKQVALRDVTGEDSPRSAMMKQMAAIR